jgi:hypothetical protein
MVTATAAQSDEELLSAWAESAIGGRVTRIERLARWRPAWDFDVDLGYRVLPLHARGERESGMAMPYWIADERRTHDLLEAHGIPVPHVYGYCDAPYSLVMDRLPGFVDLSFADSDQERAALNLEYLELLARIYGIDLDEAAAAGFECPTTAEEIALDLFGRYEEAYEARMSSLDPVSEFLRRWLHRNYPRHRTERRFITYDAFQFMFDHGRISGLIDFELAQVGDPLTELAALRIRDTIKNLGDLPAIAASWSQVTGEALDFDVIEFHTVAYNANTVLSSAPLIASPSIGGDLMSHLGWYTNSARWAFEEIADILGVELQPIEQPAPQPSRNAAAFDHLVNELSNRGPGLGVDDPQRARLFRIARHLRRLDEIGRQLEDDDVADASQLVGHPVDPPDIDATLVRFIAGAGADRDADLVDVLDRRVRRQQLALGPEGSMFLRHPRLRSLRPGADGRTAADDDLPWTPGLITGTR